MTARPLFGSEVDEPFLSKSTRMLIEQVILTAILVALIEYSGRSRYALPRFNLLFFVAGYYIAVIVHELAHLVTSIVLGLGVDTLAIAGLAVSRPEDGWAFTFHKRCILGGFFKSKRSVVPSRAGVRLCVDAAGPVASLLFAAAMWMAVVRFGNGAHNWLSSFFWAATVIALLNLVPSEDLIYGSDLSKLHRFVVLAMAARRRRRSVVSQAAEAAGLEPGHWRYDLFQVMLTSAKVNPEAQPGSSFANRVAWYRRSSECEDAAALAHLEKGLRRYAQRIARQRAMLRLHIIHARVLYRLNPGMARRFPDSEVTPMTAECAIAFAAGIAICEKRYDDVIRLLAQAAAQTPELPG